MKMCAVKYVFWEKYYSYCFYYELQLKAAAAGEFKVAAEQLCFVQSGKPLQDDELLEDGSTVHLVIKSHIQVGLKYSSHKPFMLVLD